MERRCWEWAETLISLNKVISHSSAFAPAGSGKLRLLRTSFLLSPPSGRPPPKMLVTSSLPVKARQPPLY